MAQQQDYQVNYKINVDASQGASQVKEFAKSVESLMLAKGKIEPAVNNIKTMMTQIDAAFRTKGGKKRDYSYQFNIDTSGTEKKLERVQALLEDIKTKCAGITLAINAGERLQTQTAKANANKALTNKQVADQQKATNKLATDSVRNVRTAQKEITKSIGKINSALAHLGRAHQVNIQTDVAKQRLAELLGMMNQVRSAGRSFQLGGGTLARGAAVNAVPAPLNPAAVPYVLPQKAQDRLNERLYSNQQLHRQRMAFSQENAAEKARRQADINAARAREREEARQRQENARRLEKRRRDYERAEKERIERQRRADLNAMRYQSRISSINDTVYGNRRRSAINRLQYSRPPSLRRAMPYAYMLNGYMAYSLMRKEVTAAVEYANIMQSAQSILKVADTDLSTFQQRFDDMAANVRKVGVETKFTAVEIAGAVKFLAMAGQGIDTINKSIRPITNLALIGDNDVAQIADLTTNIMAGYDISPDSMPSVADIIASTISRSNVNIIETAESFKMSAGFLRSAGVEFSEASAAIGLLGNMGVKGTMAGTSLRAMATRFAKPPKEAQKILDRLGVKFTQYEDIYGVKVEKLRSLADIFEDLNKAGATMGDMHAIFGKIGGNAGMMMLQNYDKLRELTAHNRASHGISGELAHVKQETTKGLWYQVTSQLSETFMGGYEILEPQIKATLRSFLDKFKNARFEKGLASIGKALLDIFSTLTSIATWFARNFTWLEPLIFTGFVATRLYKLAAAVTNLGVAFGFLGKQKMLLEGSQAVSGLFRYAGGFAPAANAFKAPYAFRAPVIPKVPAVAAGKAATSASSMVARGAASGVFASQVATGNGVIGATASIGALGTTAVVATAGIAALVGALGWVAYKTWKVKEAKDAVLEELESNRKYRYPSIDALYDSLAGAYDMAIKTKDAVDEVTKGKKLQDVTGHKVGAWTGNWWTALISSFGRAEAVTYGGLSYDDFYDYQDAYQDDLRASIRTLADIHSQERINSAYAKFGAMSDPVEVRAFMSTIQDQYGQSDETVDSTLWNMKNGRAWYVSGLKNMTVAEATKTWDYQNFHNTETVNSIRVGAQAYHDAIATVEGAREAMRRGNFNFGQLEKHGFFLNEEGMWVQKALGKNATDKEREDQVAGRMNVNNMLVRFIAQLRDKFGSSEAAQNILIKAGFSPSLFSNEPNQRDERPFDANGITVSRGADDDMAGGNYSGTGKLSSAAPKQVIVNIESLLSLDAINLMNSPAGDNQEIRNLKEQMAQALIDVVHDFDASWNG